MRCGSRFEHSTSPSRSATRCSRASCAVAASASTRPISAPSHPSSLDAPHVHRAAPTTAPDRSDRLMGAQLPLGDPAPADGNLGVSAEPATDFGVYLHVPFCRVRCGYCDFNTYTATELRGARQDQYADTLIQEIELARRVLDEAGALRPMDTVFFGGGTPTLLPAGDLARMLSAAAGAFGIRDGAEVTVEANPDTVTPEVARTLLDAGVNRLSIGMQSAVPHVLATLDRTHRPENVGTAVAAARAAGLDVSVDLIYGAPGESLADWEQSLDAALALEPDHISAYALIIEDGTKLARQIRRGEVAAPD